MTFRIALIAFVLGLFAAACGTAGDDQPDAPVQTTTTVAVEPSVTTAPNRATSTTVPLSPLAGQTTSLGSALYDETDHKSDQTVPVAITIDRIGVDRAPVLSVGVADNGDMEIPGADGVGWYRYNPTPGAEGSSVLAAHIAYRGTPGVFRYLADTDVGDIVVIDYDDGTSARFEIVEVAQYNKGDLPKDRIFAKTGDPVLTLITCGGEFNRALRSYYDNIVAYAVPLDA
jgi:LPXTG-site transpeptidase (sortase) family protein